MSTYLSHRRDAQEITRLLLADKDLGRLVGYDTQDFLGFIFIGHAETMFRFRDEGVMSEEVWSSMEALIKLISKMEFVTSLWPRVSFQYTPDFAAYFDGLLVADGRECDKRDEG